MSESRSLGQKGEELAAAYLQQAGYVIRHRNWRSGRTEIDIIAELGGEIVFVEVKTRSSDYAVHPAEAVNVPKQRTIVNAASGYLSAYKIDKQARFDIITIISSGTGYEIDHIENAWYPTL